MTDDQQTRADEAFASALETRGSRDPREYYRERLRELKTQDDQAYQVAVNHYREVLIPGIADNGDDPLRAWMEYGRLLAELSAPGRTVCVDESGKSADYDAETALGMLVVHLPDNSRGRALLVGLPPEPSPAQRATFDLMVQGKKKLPG
jgi:hypothetical protein